MAETKANFSRGIDFMVVFRRRAFCFTMSRFRGVARCLGAAGGEENSEKEEGGSMHVCRSTDT